MDDFEKEHLNTEQARVDLVELGAVRAAGTLITEFNAKVENDALTIEELQSANEKLSALLALVAKSNEDLESLKKYYAKKYENKDAQTEVKDA